MQFQAGGFMRKLLIAVFASHWLFFSGLLQAQVPRGSIDLKAKKAQTGTEESVRELAYGVFEPFGWANRGEVRNRLAERMTRAELSYRNGQHPTIREENVVNAINSLVSRAGGPEYSRTSLMQVRYLRTALMVRAPNLVAVGAPRSSGDKELPRTMSPIEATYVTLSLIHQKLYNPKFQEDDNGASWLERRQNETVDEFKARAANSNRPRLLSLSNPRADEMRKVVANVLSLPSASTLPDMVLDDLGVSQ
jgi:hypothetical protein